MPNRKCRRNLMIVLILVSIVIATQIIFDINLRDDSWRLFNRSQDLTGLEYVKINKKIKLKKDSQGCLHPQYQIWSAEYAKNADRLTAGQRSNLDCSSKSDPVWIDVNGKFRYSPNAIHKAWKCKGQGVIREFSPREDKISYSQSFEIIHGKPTKYDYVIAFCGLRSYYLIGITRKEEVNKRKMPLNAENGKAMDIVIIGYDSTSQLSMLRNMPTTVEYFEEQMQAVRLSEYNIVGDGTPAALLPILTGQSETELPEARYSKPNRVKNMDNFPFIWKRLREQGYATQWGEDAYKFGTFTYRLAGFNKQPVDHYMRNFYIMINNQKCIGVRNSAENMLYHVDQFLTAYNDRPKFSFMFHSEYTHNSMGTLSVVDKPLRNQLKQWNNDGKLNNTLLILMSDHGNRYTNFRNTMQGKIEERTPYFAIRYPDWFIKRYPVAIDALRKNAEVLTTPYDIYETMLDTLAYDSHSELRGSQRPGKRQSLLRPIQPSRNCLTADIEAHWCGCLDWKTVKKNSKDVINAAKYVISFINNYNQKEVYMKCQRLRLQTIKEVVSFQPKIGMLKFMKSSDFDGRIASMNSKINSGMNNIMYQLTIIVSPSKAIFECTIAYNVDKQTFFLHESQISRINKYGDQPNCIAEKFPHMRQFCFCK